VSQFLLPCVCGQRLTVGANQAGELIHCRCGQTVEVPTLRELNRLERVADRSAPPAAAWSKRQGLILLGAVVAVLSLGALVWLELHRPPSQESVLRQIKTPVDRFSIAQSWDYWNVITPGIGRPVPARIAAFLDQNQQERTSWLEFVVATLALAGLGLLLLIIGLLLPRRRAPRTADSTSSRPTGPGL
jgi:hypothetical protein